MTGLNRYLVGFSPSFPGTSTTGHFVFFVVLFFPFTTVFC